LATVLWYTEVDLEAVLDTMTMPLQNVLAFEVGNTIMLNATATSTVQLSCGGVQLMKGKMGRVNNHVSIRVTKDLKGVRHSA
jgi:flagellar motor switch protein FliM